MKYTITSLDFYKNMLFLTNKNSDNVHIIIIICQMSIHESFLFEYYHTGDEILISI